jgi:hypothetical protein
MLLTGYACVKDVDVGTATRVLYSVGIAHWNDQRDMVVVLVVLVCTCQVGGAGLVLSILYDICNDM